MEIECKPLITLLAQASQLPIHTEGRMEGNIDSSEQKALSNDTVDTQYT